MRLNNKLSFLALIFSVSLTHAHVSANGMETIRALAEYKNVSIECGKYRGKSYDTDIKYDNPWFNSLSDDDKKTALFVSFRSLESECMIAVEQKLVIAMFNDAAATGDTTALLLHVELMRPSKYRKSDAEYLRSKTDRLDTVKLAEFKKSLK